MIDLYIVQEVVEPLNVMLETMPQKIITKNVSYFKTGPMLASSKR